MLIYANKVALTSSKVSETTSIGAKNFCIDTKNTSVGDLVEKLDDVGLLFVI